jgi:hypothetical protein
MQAGWDWSVGKWPNEPHPEAYGEREQDKSNVDTRSSYCGGTSPNMLADGQED